MISIRHFWLTIVVFSTTTMVGVSGFGLNPPSSSHSSSTALHLTSEEILARARKAVGMPEEEGPQFVFDEDLLNDMQSALLKLEHRIQEGPGSLSMLEVEELDGEINRILDEMHRNPHKRLPRPNASQTNGEEQPQSVAAPEAPVVAASAPAVVSTENPQLTQSSAAAETAAQQTKPRESIDTSNDEGPEYTGTGGMGLAKGTANTYQIEGMEEMSPDEYRKALDKSISDRARQRREAGVVGNASSWNYLNSLGGGSTGALKR